ncbi:MAG: PD-(D/E)XK motif protein [Spirochaetes bacterium]|nr:PD-(D/E)XK motif protein [Spirochaetota bacterium]
MPDHSKMLNWQSLCSYLKNDHDTPIPLYGSDRCVLVIRPSMGIELQMRDDKSFSTEISSLPHLIRFTYEKANTANYSYLAIKCELPNLLEAVLDFFYSISNNIITENYSPKDSITKSYNQYKAILAQPLTPSPFTLVGLWGELYVIYLVLKNSKIDPDSIVLNWTGPLGQPNDFSFGRTAIEIKTTSKQINVVEISSFEQLDADRSWIVIIHAFHTPIEDGGKSIKFLVNSISEKLTSAVKEILENRINVVLNSLTEASSLNFSMKSDGTPSIVEISDSIPVLNRSKLNCIFGESTARLIERGRYVLNLSSVEYTRKKIDEVFLEAQRYGE